MIWVRYSCDQCGLTDSLCQVPARRKETPVQHYMGHTVVRAIAADHQIKSFCCEASKIRNVILPVPDNADPETWIGKQTDNMPPTFADLENAMREKINDALTGSTLTRPPVDVLVDTLVSLIGSGSVNGGGNAIEMVVGLIQKHAGR